MTCCDSCKKGLPCESKDEQSKGEGTKQHIDFSLGKSGKFHPGSSKFSKGGQIWKYGFTFPLDQVSAKTEGKLKEPTVIGSKAPDLYLLTGSSGIQGLASPASSELSFPRAPRKASMERRQMSQRVTTGGDRVW